MEGIMHITEITILIDLEYFDEEKRHKFEYMWEKECICYVFVLILLWKVIYFLWKIIEFKEKISILYYLYVLLVEQNQILIHILFHWTGKLAGL